MRYLSSGVQKIKKNITLIVSYIHNSFGSLVGSLEVGKNIDIFYLKNKSTKRSRKCGSNFSTLLIHIHRDKN